MTDLPQPTSKTPFPGLSKRQIEVFEQIATGVAQPAGVTQRTITALVNYGAIHRISDKIMRDRLGTFVIPQYEATLHAHMQWCKWCADKNFGALQ